MYALHISLEKSLVCLAIEKTLLAFGTASLDEVRNRLKSDYNADFFDCYDHPGYLSTILEDLYGMSHIHIVKSIKEKLEEFSYRESITRFIQSI